MKFIDYYEVLQISPNVDTEIIRASFKQLSKMYHPDTYGDNGDKFLLIKEAYEVLSEQEKRDAYNITWKEIQKKKANVQKYEVENKNHNVTKKDNASGKRAFQFILVTLIVVIILPPFYSYFFPSEKTVTQPRNETIIESLTLNSEDYSKLKTNAYFSNYGHATFEIYNGTDYAIYSYKVEINVHTDQGDIVDTRVFEVDTYIAPLKVREDVIETGIKGVETISDSNLIEPELISWRFIEVIVRP